MINMRRKNLMFITGLIIIVSAWFLYFKNFSSPTPELRGMLGQSLIWMILGWFGICFGATGIYEGFKKKKTNL